MKLEPQAYILAGPTAAGKSDVAQRIAEEKSYDILSADAMMVYRGMDIGTAKPCRELRDRVRYWGLDLAAPTEAFSAGQYRAHAIEAIGKSFAEGREIIMVGGTGLYIKSLTHGLGKLPAPDPAVRAAAEALLNEKGLGALQELVRAITPELYEALPDKNNPRRLVRLLEASDKGVAGGTWKALGKGPKITGLSMPKAILDERIVQRVRKMYADGLLEEAERLLEEGIEKSPTAMKAIGYAEAFAVLRKKITAEEAVELTSRRTRQYAKRQMTWFRNQADVDWIMIEPGMTIEQTAEKVRDSWRQYGPTPIAS